MADSQLNRKQALAVAHYVGFRGRKLVTAVAVAGAESGRQYLAVGPPNWDGSVDRGWFQINSKHTWLSEKDALLPIPNARAAYQLSNEGKDFTPWAAYNQGRYLANVEALAEELAQEKDGEWAKSIADREAAFRRVGDSWVPS